MKANGRTKLIEGYAVTDASVHDSQVVDELIAEGDSTLHADSAYRSEEVEQKFSRNGIESCIHEKGYRNKPLTEEQKKSNHEKSRVRARVEHIFGHMTQAMHDGLKLRFIGMRRIAAGIGFLNLVYNMARYEQIVRLKLA